MWKSYKIQKFNIVQFFVAVKRSVDLSSVGFFCENLTSNKQ